MVARQPLVTSLSMVFKQATGLTEDVEEVKKEHRTNLKGLVDKYMEDVSKGKAEGIRNAKELVEVIKADMLLLGENTEKIGTDTPDEIRLQKVSEALNLDDPNLQAVVDNLMKTLNGTNDDYGKGEFQDNSYISQFKAEEEIQEAIEDTPELNNNSSQKQISMFEVLSNENDVDN